jgi:hypothetical protein
MKSTDQLRLLLDLDERVKALEAIIREGQPLVYEAPAKAATYTAPEEPVKAAPKRKKKKKELELDFSSIEFMSRTELVQVCHWLGHEDASLLLPREDLESLIVGEEVDVFDPLEEIREKTYLFVSKNERLMRSMMACDLDCSVCPHHQVVECYTINHEKVENS